MLFGAEERLAVDDWTSPVEVVSTIFDQQTGRLGVVTPSKFSVQVPTDGLQAVVNVNFVDQKLSSEALQFDFT